MNKLIKKNISFIAEIVKKALDFDFPGMASEMAFNFILALFPFIIFMISLFGIMGSQDIVDKIIHSSTSIVPPEALNLIESVLSGIVRSSSSGLITFGFLGFIWTASNATAVIMKCLNKAYEIEETRPFWYTRLLAIFAVLLIAVVLVLSANLIIMGSTILEFIRHRIDLPHHVFMTVLLIRWPISFLALFLMALTIYYLMPNLGVNPRKRLATAVPGALFFCVLWLFASWGFGLYVENFGRYNQVYGTLGGVIILLVWLYYSSLVILIGGEINSRIYNRTGG